jgi:arylsulfatase A-like enzyme
VSPVPWTDYRQATDITDTAIAFVQAQPHRQWFLMVHYMDVAGPLRPDPEDVDALGDGPGSALVDAYDASLHEVDRHVGRLLEALPKGAIVVVTSDHGDQLGETRPKANEAPGGERHGHSLHQEALRVPLIIAGPGVRAGRVTRMVSLVDVTPTLLDLGGAEPIETSGYPLVEITGGDVPSDRAVVAEAVRWGSETQMARIDAMKLIRKGGEPWMYNLGADPFEAAPLTGTADVELQWASILEARLTKVGAASTSAAPSLGADVADLVERVR